jgi:hypothetical protein
MVSSRMLRRVALVRTDVSEDPSASFIRVTRIGELVPPKRRFCCCRVCRDLHLRSFPALDGAVLGV